MNPLNFQTKFSLRNRKKTLRNFSILLGLFLLFSFLTIWLWQGIYLARAPRSQNKINFLVQKGERVREIASRLENEQLIKSKIFFLLYFALRGESLNLQAGRYFLSSAMNIPRIIKILSKGEVARNKITIPEGWNLKDIGQYLQNNNICQEKEFFNIVGFPAEDPKSHQNLRSLQYFSSEFSFLQSKPKGISLEGYIFPDTYYFQQEISSSSNQEVQKLVQKALTNFGEKLTPELREAIKRQGKTIFQIITMASLLEREVKTYPEKQIVAGILWKRLKNNWFLQVDSTLTYLTGRGSSKLTKSDLNIDSPYNTYKYRGLPQGPICNPGLESIEAAIYYKKTPYWYYFTNPEGKTVFSKTLKEHNLQRAGYREMQTSS